MVPSNQKGLRIAMLSIHSSPTGPLGTRDTGGMSVYIREVARHLGQNNHKVDIFTFQPGEDQNLYPNVRLIHLTIENTGLELKKEEIPSHLPRVFEALDHYRRQDGRDYDLIHSHYWLSGMVGTMAQTRWQRPHVTMFHTLAKAKNNTASGENEPDWRVAHEKWLTKTADYIVVPTVREKENLVRYYSAQPTRIGIIPCGVDLDLFRPCHPREGQQVRETLGIPAQAPMLLYVGRFAPLKGLDQLVAAAPQLRKRYPELHLVLMGGDGPTAPATVALQRQADSLDMTRRIHFAGRVDQDQLPSYYSAADLVVLPSHYESFGLVVLESLACGTPVAATSVGVAAEVIQEELNGVIIAAPDVQNIASAVDRLFHRPEQEWPSRQAIRESVRRFDWRSITKNVAEIYTNLVAHHEPQKHSGKKSVN
jgi:D-inositol-3-phosphate glycosyltransferase